MSSKKSSQTTPDYPGRLLVSLNELRKEDQLCDVVITVNGREFSAHKNVLAARSSYFLAMFTSGFREASESKVNIEGKPEVFEEILDFVYTGKMKISGETACELFEMACYMQLNDASEDVAKLIQDELYFSSKYGLTKMPKGMSIPIGDVYKIFEMASCEVNHKVLARIAVQHLSEQFKKLKSCDIFLQRANAEFMKKFFLCTDLSNVDEEKEVLELVVKWLKHDLDNRREFAPSLLKRVRLGLVPRESLTQLLDEAILAIPGCQEILDFTTRVLDSSLSKKKRAKKYPRRFTTRSTITAPIEFTFPEDGTTDEGTLKYFDTKAKQWKKIPSMQPLTWMSSFIVVGDKLYAVGGVEYYEDDELRDHQPSYWDFHGGESIQDSDEVQISHRYKAEFRRYDAGENCWHSLPRMSIARQPQLVHLDGCIYAVSGEKRYSFVECYEMAKRKWKKVSPLPDGFECSSAVAFHGSLLLYGQYGDSKHRREILVYDPSTNKWKSQFQEPQGKATRYGCRPILFVHKDQIYRIAFHDTDRSFIEERKEGKSTVHLLELQMSRKNTVKLVSLGKKVKQDFIPANNLGGFRIGKEVFVTVNSDVYQTDLKIKKDQNADIDFGHWKRLDVDFLQWSNIVTFTCDINIQNQMKK